MRKKYSYFALFMVPVIWSGFFLSYETQSPLATGRPTLHTFAPNDGALISDDASAVF
jgi:hypothetical protein